MGEILCVSDNYICDNSVCDNSKVEILSPLVLYLGLTCVPRDQGLLLLLLPVDRLQPLLEQVLLGRLLHLDKRTSLFHCLAKNNLSRAHLSQHFHNLKYLTLCKRGRQLSEEIIRDSLLVPGNQLLINVQNVQIILLETNC